MSEKDKRIFKRYSSQAECKLRIGTETYTGELIDYSIDGISAIFEDMIETAPGTQAEITALDSNLNFKGEIVWVKDSGGHVNIGFKRIDTLKGNLKNLELSDILIGLQRSTKTGTISIESGSVVKKIFVDNGNIIFATSSNEDDRLGEVLFKKGHITLEQYTQSSNLMKKTGQRFGKVLVDLAYLTPKELFEEVRLQIEEILLSLFTIEEGRFEFQEGPVGQDETITLRISAANLVFRGIKRINNFLHIKWLCPPVDTVLNLSPNPLNIFQDLTVEDIDKKILSYVNGKYSIKTILSLSPSKDFETLKTLLAFLSAGLVKVKEEGEEIVRFPIEDLLEKPEEELSTEFVATIEEMHQRCDTLENYTILGVSRDALIEEIKEAYYKLSKQFHPDRHFSLPSSDIDVKGKLITIIFDIKNAYETLSDPDKRREYNKKLSLTATGLMEDATGEPSIPDKEPESETIRTEELAEIPLEQVQQVASPPEPAGTELETSDADEHVVQEEIPEIAEPETAVPEEPETKDEESILDMLTPTHEQAVAPEEEKSDIDIKSPEENESTLQEQLSEPSLEEQLQQVVSFPEPAGTELDSSSNSEHVVQEEIPETAAPETAVPEQPAEEPETKDEESILDMLTPTHEQAVAPEEEKSDINIKSPEEDESTPQEQFSEPSMEEQLQQVASPPEPADTELKTSGADEHVVQEEIPETAAPETAVPEQPAEEPETKDEESILDMLTPTHEQAVTPEEEKSDIDIKSPEEDESTLQEQFREPSMEEQVQQVASPPEPADTELETSGADEHVVQEEIPETAAPETAVPEQPVEELIYTKEEPQLDSVAPPTVTPGRKTKSNYIYIPVALVAMIALVFVSSILYKNYQGKSQTPIPAVTKTDAVVQETTGEKTPEPLPPVTKAVTPTDTAVTSKSQGKTGEKKPLLPAFRDEFFSKLLTGLPDNK